jgi:hypothetical protein
MKYFNITSSPPKLVAPLFGAMLLGLVSQSALAAGTTAGNTIDNTANLTYLVGGVDPTGGTGINSTSASFVVDEKINLTVAGGVTTSVLPGATAQATAFTVTNNSNSPLDFSLSVVDGILGDQFNPVAASCVAYEDNQTLGTLGVYDANDTATFVNELPADATRTVFVVCNIPSTGVVDTDTALVALVATARGDFTGPNNSYAATAGLGAVINDLGAANTANVDIVFADAAGTDDGPGRDAAHSARNTYQINSAILGLTKTSTLLCDPVNGVANQKNIPGAMVRWTIQVTNSGTASATLSNITDTLVNMTHETSLAVPVSAATCVDGAGASGFSIASTSASADARPLGGTAGVMTNAADADGATIAGAGKTIDINFADALPGGTVGGTTWTAGEVKPTEVVTVIFNALID